MQMTKNLQTPPPRTPEILTVSEIAVRLRVPASWVYSHADLLGAFHLGKYLRFHWERVLERLTASAPSTSALGSQPNDLAQKP